jgi:hypothetical protein
LLASLLLHLLQPAVYLIPLLSRVSSP